jgi:hypothetical protein
MNYNTVLQARARAHAAAPGQARERGEVHVRMANKALGAATGTI